MSNLALRVQHLGKRYRIGARQPKNRLLGDVLVTSVKAPVQRAAAAFRRAPVETTGQSELFWALRDVSFELVEGEALGIIGRNGAGKSTLLKILARITKPTTGRVELYGRVGSLLEVGTGFHPELTGRENIYLNGAILGMRRSEIARKFDEIVAFAEIEEFIDTPAKHYSSGMYLRLAFAVAAHLEPDILIVDEVLAVGDAAFQKKCLGKMEDVSRNGRTVLFVSHDMTTILRLCSKTLYIKHGEIAGIGAVSSLIANYLADSRQQLYNSLDHSLPLGTEITLTEFGTEPNPAVSGGALDFFVRLDATRSGKIDGLSILIFDSLNRRVGILDVGSSRVDLQACKLEYSIVSPK